MNESIPGHVYLSIHYYSGSKFVMKFTEIVLWQCMVLLWNAWWEKKSNLVMRFVGNLTTWREILTFDIKKYIRNGGKCNYIPGKNAFFQTLVKQQIFGAHTLLSSYDERVCAPKNLLFDVNGSQLAKMKKSIPDMSLP